MRFDDLMARVAAAAAALVPWRGVPAARSPRPWRDRAALRVRRKPTGTHKQNRRRQMRRS